MKDFIEIKNARINNLRGVDVRIPKNKLTVITGVSGSGKSSLISDTLVPRLKELLKNNCVVEQADDEDEVAADALLIGTEHIKDCFIIDQRPIGRNKTSCPATYIGIMDRIRNLFAATDAARESGCTVSMFTRNSDGGCPRCKGEGMLHHYVGYGSFMDLVCDDCEGTGYVDKTRAIFLDGKNICDVLNMSVDEAEEFFKDKDEEIINVLQILQEVGMGYITLGQSIPTISGGESQRIKLAKELSAGRKASKKKSKGSLYILDEPTTGLSLYDTERLLSLLNEIVECRNSVIITEHDVHMLANCDYLIEMGKGGGREGGEIIATGTPKELKENSCSLIGRYLP